MSTVINRPTDGQIALDSLVALPPILDLLIAGGGPMGTACAFRAKELGLAALVIEMDDLMKRIRDYAKDKPILPDYGGGDVMQFPAGGDLVTALRFEPIDKDHMVEHWKALYRRFSVPAKIGVELLQLDLQADGVWRVHARNHLRKTNETYQARHVVLALGRGVPRRLDIPGNVQDLALRLADAQQYVGGPACVIGGGTSAAEAVIAISNAKVQSGTDESPVYWSYRGRYMPKVSQALAESLFEVLMINGNLQFALGSEPIGIIRREDREFLAVRTAVSEQPGLPRQVVQLEFEKAHCVACIGADRPDPLLRDLGIEFLPKESGDGDRIVVTPLLESRRRCLYVGGDLLSPDHVEAGNFDADPSTFVVRARRGNIKAALRDGVLLAEVVKQRLEGREDIRVILEPEPATTVTPIIVDSGRMAPTPADEVRPGSARLVSLLADGTPADEFRLNLEGDTVIGRLAAQISFPEDTLLSDQHAAVSLRGDRVSIRDLGSQNGVFFKVPEGRAVPLAPGSIVKAGRQWLVSTIADGSGGIDHYDAKGKEIANHAVPGNATIVLGRAAPAKILDAADTTLSRAHLSFSFDQGQLLLRDLGSRNGTFVKVGGAWELQDGDVLWMGNQLLRLSLRESEADTRSVVVGKAVPPAPTEEPKPEAPPPAPPAASQEPLVSFGPGKSFPIAKSGTLLDLALAKRIRIKYECKVGDCGKCRVRVVEGMANLEPRSALESKALRMVGHEEPESRLACVVSRINGSITVEIPR